MYDFLRKVPLFADLSEADLERLCEMIDEVHLPAGAELFAEGSMGDRAYVIKEGELEILKASGGREVLLVVRQSGEVIGEMSILEEAPRMASARARNDSVLLAISKEQLNELLDTSPSAARAMLHSMTARLRGTEIMLRQSDKMAQLGKLTAGVAHELNNPAAAAERGAGQLREAMAQLQQSTLGLNQLPLSVKQSQALQALDQVARARGASPSDLDALERSDLESDVESWLEDQGIENGWELAPELVNLGYKADGLARLRADFGPATALVLAWLSATATVYSLLEEIGQGAGRIAEIVKALKGYAFLDQAPVQAVDIHEGLDNTLVMLRGKLKTGVTVRRDYAQPLPRIQAYGSELNQVWTNILDNAVDAMNGQGQIVIRTRGEDADGTSTEGPEWVVVEIEDNGPGIPEAIQSKIFDPFFTTKEPGKGTGLGLNISYRIIAQKHRGEITVYSQPGKTCFQVRLPVNFAAGQQPGDGGPATPPVSGVRRLSDEELRHILTTAHNVAVVGISDRQDRPAYSVPAYLQANGYRIIPVNPNLSQVLGEKAYPELDAVPEPIDIVQIFRRGEAVPAIVAQAIKVGAKVVWMQEGVVNEAAAQMAREAGLQVVADACMRSQHRRLIHKNE